MNPQDLVTEFHTVFQAPVKTDGPGWHPDKALMNLRLELIREEWQELQDAYEEQDFVEVVDALADLIYVIYGFANGIGIDLDKVLEEVHRSNMTKLDVNGDPVFREDGKVLKSELFEEPKIAEVLEEQGWLSGSGDNR